MPKVTQRLTRRLTSPIDVRPTAPNLPAGGGANSYAPYAAPAGAHWEFVTRDGVTVTSNGVPIVGLVWS